MAKRLIDGERRVVGASAQWSMFRHRRIKVEAERYDCDTPFVHLTLSDRPDNIAGRQPFTHVMADVETLDLIDRLQRAIAMLPSSK
jgi:hypothetical protein